VEVEVEAPSRVLLLAGLERLELERLARRVQGTHLSERATIGREGEGRLARVLALFIIGRAAVIVGGKTKARREAFETGVGPTMMAIREALAEVLAPPIRPG
jgi:hypothetical protein